MNSSISRRAVLSSTLLAAVWLGFASIRTAAADTRTAAKVVRDSKDPRWIHGTVVVTAPADKVMARVARVDQWTKVFSDIKSLKVVKREGDHWHLRLETRTMDCGAHDYYVTVNGTRSVKLVIDAPGINANGLITAKAADQKQVSIASFSLFVETTGVIGWFIPEKVLRARQETMVRRDLEDLAASFASP